MYKLGVFLFMLWFISEKSNSQISSNYITYHKYIEKAEQLCFLENKTDSSLFYFSKAFDSFDFVFVKDCIEAAQIAGIFKKDSLLFTYFKKAFENGFKLRNIYDLGDFRGRCKWFDRISKQSHFYQELAKIYPVARSVFLKRINIDLLNLITKRFVFDQTNKNRQGEDGLKDIIFRRSFQIIDSLIDLDLFPSEKITGVTQWKVFKETGKNYKELNEWYEIVKNDTSKTNKFRENQFTIDENELTSRYIFVLLYHYDSSYFFLQKKINKLIHSGQMHPREYASLHDMFIKRLILTPKGKKKYMVPDISVGPNILFFDKTIGNREKVNTLRKNYNIVSVEIDSAKAVFEKKYSVFLFTSWLMNR